MPKIMLAEDDITMLRLLKTLMQMEGFEVATLAQDEDILQVVEREAPDALLMDVHLPQGSGLDFVRLIRADSRFNGLLILMASGMDLHYECIDAGADQFLLKPFMPDTLVNSVRSLLSSRPV